MKLFPNTFGAGPVQILWRRMVRFADPCRLWSRKSMCGLWGLGLSIGMPTLPLAETYFDPTLLNLPAGVDPHQIDLSAFTEADQTPAGRYMVTLWLNQQSMGQREMVFSADPQGKVTPDITPALLAELGVNVSAIPPLKSLPADTKIDNLADYIPAARVQFDMAKLRLNLSVPQVAMRPEFRGYIDPKLLDQGINALLLNYQFTTGHQWVKGSSTTMKSRNDTVFANLRGGVNLGAWRLRSTMTYTDSTSTAAGKTTHTDFSNTHLMHDIQRLHAEFLVGESSTGNAVLDSIPFKGIKLASNEQMLPNSARGFAPNIRGIAQSNARITIRQNGQIIYQTYVAPGPFNINDLYATGSAGDLDISITEEDGSVRTFTQAFSTLPVMLRPGGIKYEITAGQYNGGITNGSKAADFVQGTLIYGLPHSVTLYGGALAAKHYYAAVFGTGISLGQFGALSSDITQTSAQLPGATKTGQSYRFRYSKNLLETGTSIDLTALRYSTKDYYSFADYNQAGYQIKQGLAPWLTARQRSSFQTYINQSLGDWGGIYLQGMRENYWGTEQTITTLGVGYNGSVKGVNYTLSYSISRAEGENDWPENRQVALNVSVPFSVFSHQPWAQEIQSSYQISHDNQGRTYQQLGVNGRLLDNALTYQFMESGDNQSQHHNSTLNLGYQGDYGYLGGGYSYGSESQSLNFNANGGIVAHAGGVTLSRFMGSSMAVVEAPDASGSTLNGGTATVDPRGYAVVPYLIDYSKNTVNLDVNTLPENITTEETSINLYPTKGAIVKARFQTKKGYQALMTLKSEVMIPLGATVVVQSDKDSAEQNTSIVGDGGQVYLSGLSETGYLDVKWGNTEAQHCRAKFNLAEVAENPYSSIRQLTVPCSSLANSSR
ncbi:fimbria/pilus outer membrane usher protein [Providencia hangzhouensis]|uniref:fimbria/pilus outer membrane usher protein n=1 Tax=Providencia hangzhouensis TaxID=3031799 RepID=UPI0034DD45DD